jgi:Protein of unknown function (DUF4232)
MLRAAVAALVLLAIAGCGTSSPGATRSCRIGQMKISLGPLVSEKTEQHTAPIVLTNLSGTACALRGYPRIELADQFGGTLPFTYAHEGDQMITAAHPDTVRVAGHATVYFAFNKNACIGFTDRDARMLQIVLPGGSSLSRPIRLPHYPIIDYCPRGDPGSTITISPIEANAARAFCRTTAPCGNADARRVVAVCTTSQLAIRPFHLGAALGTVGGYIGFRNTSSVPCSLSGWPTLVAVTRTGQSAKVVHAWSTMFGPNLRAKRAPTVILHHGERADAVFTAGDVPGPSGTCPSPYRFLRVTPPNDTRSVRVSAWITGLGAYLPRCTGIYLSVVVPSADLYHG